MYKSRQPLHRWAIGILVLGSLVRLAIVFWLPPGFDEAYYYLYTQHLDWSYFDHPPLVAWVTGLGPWLSGEVSQFTIRLGAWLLYGGSLWMVYLTGLRLFSPITALLTLGLATAIPMFPVAFGSLTLPDAPLIFFGTATLWLAAAEFFPLPTNPYSSFQSESRRYQPSPRLALIGLLVGLACLSKYHGFFLGLGLVLFCAVSVRHRVALHSRWTWLGAGLFLLALLPVLIWNAQHDWASFRFQSGRAIPVEASYRWQDLAATFLAAQAFLLPLYGLPLWWVMVRGTFAEGIRLWHGLQRTNLEQKHLLILAVSVPQIALFTVMGGYRQILPTWPMPGYWGMLLLLGYQAGEWFSRSRGLVRRWLWSGGLVGVVLIGVALLHLNLGIVQRPSQYALMGGFWPPETDPSTQLIDISQLRQGLAESDPIRAALEQAEFIFTNHYFLGGQIGMALAPLTRKPLTCFSQDMRGFAFWSDLRQWVGKSGLYITSAYFQGNPDPRVEYGQYFRSIQFLDEVPLRRGGEVVQTFRVFVAQELLKPYPRPYGIGAPS